VNDRRIALPALALAVLAGPGCTDRMDDPYNVLQGGELTVFDNTTRAYDQPAPFIARDPHLRARWFAGDLLYDTDRVANSLENPPPAGTGGLGPLYTGKSCRACHAGAGRTTPTLFTHGGTGYDFSSFLVFLRTPNGQYHRDYGRVLHDHAIFGVRPEGRLQVKYTLVDDPEPVCWEDDGRCDPDDGRCSKWLVPPTAGQPRGYCLIREPQELCRSFPDGEKACLIRPHYRITDWYVDGIDPKHLQISVRTPLRHVGQGLMMALDRDELQALAAIRYPEYGISGKLNWVYERGRWDIGISGHKAQRLDLTVEIGFQSSLGVTNPRFPEENATGQAQEGPDFGLEITSREMADVDLYMQGSGVPARRNYTDPRVVRGEEVFYRARCHLCHAPTLHTGPGIHELIDGTALPPLAHQVIHPYSDFLLHDMGPDLGDDYPQWDASGDEWRTPALWGIGLQEIVSGNTHLLHDGRARNLLEAVMWHFGEEGAVSVALLKRMPKADRDALLAFLRSL